MEIFPWLSYWSKAWPAICQKCDRMWRLNHGLPYLSLCFSVICEWWDCRRHFMELIEGYKWFMWNHWGWHVSLSLCEIIPQHFVTNVMRYISLAINITIASVKLFIVRAEVTIFYLFFDTVIDRLYVCRCCTPFNAV